MKRIIIALSLAAATSTVFAGQYRTNAGESTNDNVTQIQLGDASGTYRNNAGDSETNNVVKTYQA